MHIGTGLKETVNKANGHPVVVPWFISRSIFSDKPIKKELRWDLIKGKCEYDSQHLVSHPDIIKWVEIQFYNYHNVIEWSNCYVGE